MKDIIKKYLINSIIFVSGILITLGTVIFQNYTPQEQNSICQIALQVPLISAHYVRSNGWHVRLPPVGSTLSAQAT